MAGGPPASEPITTDFTVGSDGEVTVVDGVADDGTRPDLVGTCEEPPLLEL